MRFIQVNAECAVWVTECPVTVGDYSDFIASDGYQMRELWSDRGWKWRSARSIIRPNYWGKPGYDQPNLPVTGVSFWEAEAFAKFADARLPSENEWEWFASNFVDDRFPWGVEAPSLERANLAFFNQLAKSRRIPVDSLPAGRSKSGLWDLLGNTGEWCIPGEDPVLVNEAKEGVLKGGCCWHSPIATDVFSRDVVRLETRDNQTGFRLIKAPASFRPTPIRHGTSDQLSGLTCQLHRPTREFRQEGLPTEEYFHHWSLTITGLVKAPKHWSLRDLKQTFPIANDRGLFVCVCRWADAIDVRGVRLKDVIKSAQPTLPLEKLFVTQRSMTSESGKIFETTLPVVQAIQENAILCFEMNGKPLTKELGAPLRLIDFARYGYKQVKALAELAISAEFPEGWWEQEAQYDKEGFVQPGTITLLGSPARRLELQQPGRQPLPDQIR